MDIALPGCCGVMQAGIAGITGAFSQLPRAAKASLDARQYVLIGTEGAQLTHTLGS